MNLNEKLEQIGYNVEKIEHPSTGDAMLHVTGNNVNTLFHADDSETILDFLDKPFENLEPGGVVLSEEEESRFIKLRDAEALTDEERTELEHLIEKRSS